MSEIFEVTQEQVDLHLRAALRTVDASSKDEIAEAATVILSRDAKDLRQVRSGALDVLKLIRSLACLGYHYALYRGRNNGSPDNLPSVRTVLSSEEVQNRSMDSGLVSTGTSAKRLDIVERATLFDDESTRKKLEVMSKWDAIFDDARNVPIVDMDEKANEFLELGKSYKITVSIEEVK